MAWQWVNDLLGPNGKKRDFNWDARCPYMLCPSNQPYRAAHKARLKFIQKPNPMVYQYKCKDCGCLTNFSIEMPDDQNESLRRLNPSLQKG